MKRSSFKFASCLLIAGACLAGAACRKDSRPAPFRHVLVSQGVFILNQGLFQNNNSTLDYYDYRTKTLRKDIFGAANSGKKLGDTGNDIEIYGSKIYIVMHGSNTVEVADARTVKSLATISLTNGGKPRLPRAIVFDKNHAFVSCFDGTVQVIDTATLQVSGFIPVGRNPERMAISAGRLFVANSGGLSYPSNYDTTVSVIDLQGLRELKKITVPKNPGEVYADKYGKVYVISHGDYEKVLPSTTLIDPLTYMTAGYSKSPRAMCFSGDSAYIFANDPVSGKRVYLLLNVKTQAVISTNFIHDMSDTLITTPFSLATDPTTKNIFIGDARDFTSNGQVIIYDRKGNKQDAFTVGLNPGFFAFYSK